MLTLVIKLEPAQEVTYTHTASLNLSVIPVTNFRLTGALPCSLTPGFSEAYLTSSEISWYTQGITIWAESTEIGQATFDIELYNSSLIAAGLQIRVSTQKSEIEPELFCFPPGSLPVKGLRLHINLEKYLQRVIRTRERSPHLFQNQYNLYRHHLDRQLQQQDHQPLAPGQRAGSTAQPGVLDIRQAEQYINERRAEYLSSSRLF